MSSLPKVLKGDSVVESGFYTCKAVLRSKGAGGENGVSRRPGGADAACRAKTEAERILCDAESASQRLMEGARQKAGAAFEAARANGYRAGFETGREESLRAMEAGIAELGALLKGLEEREARILKTYEEDLYKLALGVAKKIIDVELQADNEAFLGIYRNALQELSGAESVRLTVSEYEAEFATANAELLRSMVKNAKEIKIVALERAPRGACVVETPQAVVDAGVDTQLSRIGEAFAGGRRRTDQSR